jgi:hypothetical protein
VTEQQETSGAQPVAASAGSLGDAWAPGVLSAEPATAGQHPGANVATASDRPEVAVAAAFAGGFLLAMILRRLAR